MSLRYRLRVLDHLRHASYRPARLPVISRDLRVPDDDRDEFKAAIRELRESGEIQMGDDDLIRLPSLPDEVTGLFRLNARGFGFIIPDRKFREGDVFVPKGETADAISGDRVTARVVRDAWRKGKGRSGVTGRIIEVVERGRSAFVGTLRKSRDHWIVTPDGKSLPDDVVIRDPHAKNAKVGDKVVFELLQYPEGDYLAEGVITEVLGEAGIPAVETQAVIEAHALRTDFPEDVLQQARDATASFHEQDSGPWPDREDLTGTFIWTIDPPDARDFDDAISLVHDAEAGEWTLGVHIADVASFVTRGSPMDEEARARGNSVYLPRLVIPMLPEVLSNGVCSLQEGVPRFTKSVFITFDDRGNVLTQRASRSVIKSQKRMTYIEAQALIDGDMAAARQNTRSTPEYSDELIDTLKKADTLARILRKRRYRDGMIVLNLPEVELVFDDDGHVTDAVPEDDAYTHTIIEMFMVEANEAVARLFDGLGVPVLRRIHAEPPLGDMDDLKMYAATAHQRLPDEPTRHDLQRLLEVTRDTPAVRAIHFAVLRTLTKAAYSPAMIGHFALASEHYAHFTSPIRRYPDLAVHRALEAYLDRTENGTKSVGGRARRSLGENLMNDQRVLDEGELIDLGYHCSETEIQATSAERELREFLVLQYLAENHLGEEFDGVVTGLTGRGVFISIERFLIDGLVALQDLPGSGDRPDHWRMNDDVGRLYAKRSGASLGLGDIVRVRLDRIDPPSRHLDLAITRLPDRAAMAEMEAASRRSSLDAKRGKQKPGGKGKGKGYNKGRRGKRSR